MERLLIFGERNRELKKIEKLKINMNQQTSDDYLENLASR